MGLDADDFGQPVDDSGLMKLDESAHDGRDVACISDGHHHYFVFKIFYFWHNFNCPPQRCRARGEQQTLALSLSTG